MARRSFALVATAMLSERLCNRKKALVPTGGSRSDGTVRLSFEYGAFEKPHVDWDQATATAAGTLRCLGIFRGRSIRRNHAKM